MRTIVRRLLSTMLGGFVVVQCTAAWAVPFEELSAAKRAQYTAMAVAANALPVAPSLVEPKCLPGYVFCKLSFALFSVVVAGETLALGGGNDMAQPKAVLYRGFSGDWVLTPRDMAGDTKAELLPEPPPPAEGDHKSGDFIPPPR